jgi:hypothetical protein
MKIQVVQVREFEIELPRYKDLDLGEDQKRTLTDPLEILRFERRNFEEGRFRFEEIEDVVDTRFYLDSDHRKHELVSEAQPSEQAIPTQPRRGQIPTTGHLPAEDRVAEAVNSQPGVELENPDAPSEGMRVPTLAELTGKKEEPKKEPETNQV